MPSPTGIPALSKLLFDLGKTRLQMSDALDRLQEAIVSAEFEEVQRQISVVSANADFLHETFAALQRLVEGDETAHGKRAQLLDEVRSILEDEDEPAESRIASAVVEIDESPHT